MSQAPRLHVRPRSSKTYGDLAADFASDYGLTPDPWQQVVLDDWLATSGGRWASLTCGLSVPRQNGKNALIEVRELFGMVGRGEKFLHTAHEVKTARKAFKRLQHFFGSKPSDPAAKYPELNALVVEVRNVNGQEAIFLKNGGSVEIVARSKNSARGFTIDVLIIDEAQEMSEEDLEALMPTTSASPLRDPQWIFTGTPPGPKAGGAVFTRVRDDALSDKPSRLAWHEWSAKPEADRDDREEWRNVNPALINGRLQFEVIEGERARFSEDGFDRERLGMWSDYSVSNSALPYGAWLDLADPDAAQGVWPSFGLDVTEERRAWIAAAWRRSDGKVQVMLTNDGGSMAAGSLTTEAKRLTDKWGGTVVPPQAFEDDLETAGVSMCKASGPDFTAACGRIADLIEDGTIHHGGQASLNMAVKSARWRTSGTDGSRAFRLKDSPEVGPLAAVTRAVHGVYAMQSPEPAVY